MAPTYGSIYLSLHHPSQPLPTFLATDLSAPSSAHLETRTGSITTSHGSRLVSIHINVHETLKYHPTSTTFTFSMRSHSHSRALLSTTALLTGLGRHSHRLDEKPYTTQVNRIDKHAATWRSLRGQILQRHAVVGEEWEVRVLAFVSDWSGCWSIVRMGEPFCRLGRWEVSLEVDRLGFWVNERRRELRRGERGRGGGDWGKGCWWRRRGLIAGWIERGQGHESEVGD
jgi:hypothetical protein